MGIKIDLKEENFILYLYNGKKIQDELKVEYYRDLSEKLIGGIDKILKKNRIDKSNLKYLKLLKKPDKNRTSDRIVLSIVGAFDALK